MKLMQKIDTIKGIKREDVVKVDSNWKKYEVLSEEEVAKIVELTNHEIVGNLVKSMIWDNELEIPEIKELIDLLNLKRLFKYNIDGEDYAIILPSKRNITEGRLNHMNNMLLKCGIAYCEYKNAPEDMKKDLLTKFMNTRHKLMLAIESNIFSKNFKEMYRMKFEGVSGVCLTGNVSINGIMIPKWYAKKHNIEIGDLVIVYRDPVQNMILALKVEGFTENEMRVHSQVFTWLNGDHDGDKIQAIPLKVFLEVNKEFIDNEQDIINEVIDLLPSNLLNKEKFPNMLSNANMEFIETEEIETPSSMLDMLHQSEKSMKYADKIVEQDYLDNQASTVLNMRTVKEGTAFAGSFANWIFDSVKNADGDLELARHLGDMFQQEALDSKHTTGGKGFMDSEWYKIVSLRYSCYRDSYNIIEDKIKAILENPDTAVENDDYNDDFDF